MPTSKAGIVAVLGLALAALAAAGGEMLVLVPAVLAHSWYPPKCCTGHDCKKVDSIERLPDGDLLFRAGAIAVVVPAEFMRLPSQDNETHVCVYRLASGEYRPRCVFVPGLM